MGCVRNKGSCCGPAAVACVQLVGCFGRPVSGLTVTVTGPGGFSASLTTDADGNACFEPPASGTYSWSFAGDDGWESKSGSFAYSGSAVTKSATLDLTSGRWCLCGYHCADRGGLIPTTLYLHSAKFGSTTLTLVWLFTRWVWQGSLTGTAEGCDGEDASFTVYYEWYCDGTLNVGVTCCCVTRAVGYQSRVYYLPGNDSSYYNKGINTTLTSGYDCSLIDCEYSVSRPDNPNPVWTTPMGCVDNTGTGYSAEVAAWAFWDDTVTVNE